MGKIIDFFKSFGKNDNNEVEVSAIYTDLSTDIHIREVAFYSCVNRIANAFCKCEFKTYANGKEQKKGEYYLWNYSANKNQNASTFKTKLITKLYKDNECLVVESNDGQLLVADGFTKKESALYGDTFSNVQVGDYSFQRTFYQSDVLFFELNNNDIRSLLNGLLNKYLKLVELAFNSYRRATANKGILNVDSFAMGNEQFKEMFEKLVNEDFAQYFKADQAVLPLYEGYKYEEAEKGYKSASTTRDIKELYNDVAEFTARALNIPPSLATGSVQDTSKAIDELLTFCLDPLVKMIAEEINRKRYGSAVLKDTFIKIDTKTVKHIDLFDIASSVEKLVGSGTFTINDIRRACNEAEIDEPWANQFFMTKNFATIEELVKQLKGGGTDA